jgi:3D (Asp-Asp-Asp) domain-containing protein
MAILMALVGTFFCLSFNVVSISDGQSTTKLYTLKSDIAGILDYAGYQEDYNVKDTKKDGNYLTIEVAPTYNVFVTYENETVEIQTESCTVKEAIAQAGFEVNEKDMINLSLDTVIEEETYIDIVPYKEPVPEILSSMTNSVIPTITEVDVESNSGKTISTLVPDIDIPLDENGLPINYTSVTRVQATAYTYTGNRCSTGVNPQPGYIAVNPKVIPYGTKMYIVSADGKYTYGYAVAADTGGFIKSRPTNVDLFLTTEAACRAFGRRDIYIYFIY